MLRLFAVPLPSSSVTAPTLVYLHGLLGSSADWKALQACLTEFEHIAIDLPGHGVHQAVRCQDALACGEFVAQQVQSIIKPGTPLILLGYSLGARIVMQSLVSGLFAQLNLQGVILEGGHFGLACVSEREERLRADTRWANRFRHEPIEQVLSDWYQQPVFSSLNHEQRQTLITKRSANLGAAVADMLLSTSLGKQANLLADIQALSLPVHYVCGAKDTKFSTLALQSGLPCTPISQAGHNVHQEQPMAFAKTVRAFIQSVYQR